MLILTILLIASHELASRVQGLGLVALMSLYQSPGLEEHPRTGFRVQGLGHKEGLPAFPGGFPLFFFKISYSLKGGTGVLSRLLSKGPWSESCDGVEGLEQFYGEVMVRGDLDMALC